MHIITYHIISPYNLPGLFFSSRFTGPHEFCFIDQGTELAERQSHSGRPWFPQRLEVEKRRIRQDETTRRVLRWLTSKTPSLNNNSQIISNENF